MVSFGIRIVQVTFQMVDLSPCLKIDYPTNLRANHLQQGENDGYLPRVHDLGPSYSQKV